MTEEEWLKGARDMSGDPLHQKLMLALERRQKSYLWTPDDTPAFTPRVLPLVFGDGRALFALSTLNQRPRYWIIRTCSTWGSQMDDEDASGPDFVEMTERVLTALEDAFGNGRCSYSGTSLFWPKRDRKRACQCEDCSDSFRARWPMVDGSGGCSWGRMDWPPGFLTVPNPLRPCTTLLAPGAAPLPAEGEGAP